MDARKIANPLALAVLALLHEGPTHPYEMGRTLRERRKEQSIKLNYGSLYTVVRQLLAAGLIAERGTTREGARPDRTIYALTPAGEEELRDWMRELVSTPQKEYRQFEAALALLGVLPPEAVLTLLRERLDHLQAETEVGRAELRRAEAAGLEPFFLIEDEYRFALLDAERAWVQGLIARIAHGDDFTRPWREYHARRGTTE